MRGAKSEILTIGIWDKEDTYEQALRFVDKLDPGIRRRLKILFFPEEKEMFHNIKKLDIFVAD